MKELWELYWLFAKLGSVTFGGGYTMLPMLQREFVEKRGWTGEQEIMDYYAIGQCTPGVIAVNVSTFIGYKRKGILGGIFATLGFVTPSVIIIAIIAAFIQSFAELQLVKDAFAGIRVCVAVLIFSAFWKMRKGAVVDTITGVVCAVVFLAASLTSVSPILLIVLAGLFGVLVRTMGRKRT